MARKRSRPSAECARMKMVTKMYGRKWAMKSPERALTVCRPNSRNRHGSAK